MTDIPTSWREFQRWRKRTTFPTEALAEHALTVENDMRILEELNPEIQKHTYASCTKNIAAFANAWDAAKLNKGL